MAITFPIVSTEMRDKFPSLSVLFETDMIRVLNYGDIITVSSSWLVDLTPVQQSEMKALEIELNKDNNHD